MWHAEIRLDARCGVMKIPPTRVTFAGGLSDSDREKEIRTPNPLGLHMQTQMQRVKSLKVFLLTVLRPFYYT